MPEASLMPWVDLYLPFCVLHGQAKNLMQSDASKLILLNLKLADSAHMHPSQAAAIVEIDELGTWLRTIQEGTRRFYLSPLQKI
jgi:hypothetical protein